MINPMEMTGRTVLLTGASSGLGRDIAVLLSQLGARVVLSGRREDALRETLAAMEGEGHLVEPFDIGRTEEIPAWMTDVAGRAGPLAGLVHSAAIQATKPFRMLSAAQVDEALHANVSSAFALVKGFRQKGVCTKPRANVVLLSSVVAFVGNAGQTLYTATKGALVSATRSLALELAPEGIAVNCVAPALVDSGMGGRLKGTLPDEHYAALVRKHPFGLGTGRDVANSVAFLLADTARWYTGATLVPDGGYSAGR